MIGWLENYGKEVRIGLAESCQSSALIFEALFERYLTGCPLVEIVGNPLCYKGFYRHILAFPQFNRRLNGEEGLINLSPLEKKSRTSFKNS